ncbi:hypothetical protein ETH_00022885 [Eimeria tenella]|uniref:Uncharacterized protein n=1 Tax=Eimeria tenella TaxID=5802 RepID=U6L3L1_EIMTE|nr:hypothetical protein ETH_00022885 [Eimeria tenella]CDJ43793.1 hypothetical protein ETH_00022885 [Eimeria tenella]|eukprot:XP_013234542.1 hypothetical protein ETH_00022885 [Eimeria tenella]
MGWNSFASTTQTRNSNSCSSSRSSRKKLPCTSEKELQTLQWQLDKSSSPLCKVNNQIQNSKNAVIEAIRISPSRRISSAPSFQACQTPLRCLENCKKEYLDA